MNTRPSRALPRTLGRCALLTWGTLGTAAAGELTEPSPAVALSHTVEDSFFGVAAAVGDVNGDGYTDLLVGAPGLDGEAGGAQLYLGSAEGLDGTPARVWLGEEPGDNFGLTLATGSDLNGDGYDDVVISAPFNHEEAGRLYVYLGGPSGPAATPDATLPGAAAGAQLGRALAFAGDLNGDGYPELAAGAPGSRGVGAVLVYSGRPEGPSADHATTMEGAAYGDAFGWAVAAAGDSNGDGLGDLLIGAKGASSKAGRAGLYLGHAAGVSTTAAVEVLGVSAGEQLGLAVAGVGDLNGDGYDDLALGAPYAASEAGRVLLVPGAATGADASAAVELLGQEAGARLGWTLAGVGDLDQDGAPDLAVAAPLGSARVGEVWLYRGGVALPATPAQGLSGAQVGAWFGRAVGPAGDLDQDGFPDLLVGAPYYRAGVGLVEIYPGTADRDGDGWAAVEDCDDHNSAIYPGAVDVAGDGVDQDCDGVDGTSAGDSGLGDSGLDSGLEDSSLEDSGLEDTGPSPGDPKRGPLPLRSCGQGCASGPPATAAWALALLLGLRRRR